MARILAAGREMPTRARPRRAPPVHACAAPRVRHHRPDPVWPVAPRFRPSPTHGDDPRRHWRCRWRSSSPLQLTFPSGGACAARHEPFDRLPRGRGRGERSRRGRRTRTPAISPSCDANGRFGRILRRTARRHTDDRVHPIGDSHASRTSRAVLAQEIVLANGGEAHRHTDAHPSSSMATPPAGSVSTPAVISDACMRPGSPRVAAPFSSSRQLLRQPSPRRSPSAATILADDPRSSRQPPCNASPGRAETTIHRRPRWRRAH